MVYGLYGLREEEIGIMGKVFELNNIDFFTKNGKIIIKNKFKLWLMYIPENKEVIICHGSKVVIRVPK